MHLLFLLSGLLLCFQLLAQDPVYSVLNTQNGLPNNTIYSVLQDDKGFLWLAHERGVCRYDGVRFVQYRANMQQGFSLSNLMNLSKGQIWAQDFSGNFYSTVNDSVVKEPLLVSEGTYVAAGIINKHTLVSVKSDSIRVMNLHSRKQWSIKQPGTFSSAVCYEADAVYFVNDNIIYKFDGQKLTRQVLLKQPLKNIFFLLKTNDGFLAFSKQVRPYGYHIKGNTVEAVPLFNHKVFIQEVSKVGNEIWVGTTSGTYCYSQQLQPLYDGFCFFKDYSISRVIKDREGTYWIGTLNNGLLMVPNLMAKMYAYNQEPITAVEAMQKGTLLAGTASHRLLSFQTTTNQFKPLYKGPANHEILHIFHNPQKQETFLCSDRITQLKNFSLAHEYLIAGKNIEPLGPHFYAYAFANGFGFINTARNDTFTLPPAFTFFAGVNKKIGRGRWVLYDSSQKTLWVASNAGLGYFSPKKKGMLTFKNQPVFASSLIQQGSSVYLTTYNQGVLVIDSNYAASPILPAQKVANIYKLQVIGQEVWMLGHDRLFRFNKLKKTLDEFTVADGLPRAEFKDFKWHNQQVYIATSLGLVKFDAGTASANRVSPLLAINQVSVNGKKADWQNELYLESDENNIAIDFSVLSFRNVKAINVQYKINEQPWQALEPDNRLLLLSALAPGRYVVQIEAGNEDGWVSKAPLVFTFRVKNPIYRQYWFLLLMGIAAVALVYSWFYFRLKREQKENALKTKQMLLEQELQRSKMASIKSQMNPHFFFNALNTIQSFIYTNEKNLAVSYLNQFSELTRMILDMSNQDLISLSDEIKSLTLYLDLETQRFEEKLKYEILIDPELQPDFFLLPPMLVQPYVENAIKHGLLHSKLPWHLSIAFRKTLNGLEVAVEDNGIGRKKSGQLNANRQKHHQSFAMKANEKRLEILNKGLNNDISVEIIDKENEWGAASGTKVVLKVPGNIKKGMDESY
ncbi:MAG: histidine kinase [Chitinophagaceae bacterium]|nr:histidine kinase [Chitinophagaceae bacterium]